MLKKRNGFPLDLFDIAEITNLHHKTISKVMIGLVNKKVFYKGRTGIKNSCQFFANPFIFSKGKYINKTLYAMFKDYKE
jgi:hypothetical protein